MMLRFVEKNKRFLGRQVKRWYETVHKKREIKKLMAANRGEIAIRIFRAAHELGIRTVAIYSKEDVRSMHRYKADEAYQIAGENTPVGAYLNYEQVVKMALENEVDAIHPGYGFLSENAKFAQLCEENGIAFVGPRSEVLKQFGDKTLARELAIKSEVPVVPGTLSEVTTLEEVKHFVHDNNVGYPVMIKAAHGGGGRGIRPVRSAEELEEVFFRAQSEALAAFGNGAVFVERMVERPRHIEVQILSDGIETVHLYERDCSVQRRFQKVVEVAPSVGLPTPLREDLCADAIRICKMAGYSCAGTVEFLVDPVTWRHYFIEVNPRVQVEHTVTETCTGHDIVQAQIKIAGGGTLADCGIPSQDAIQIRGYAIQARVTTEDPQADFRPDTGRLQAWRPAEGFGIRLDGGGGFTGAIISPHYDSMLTKITASALTFPQACARLSRALAETRIRGVKTNIPFVQNVISHPTFQSGEATTSFISDHADQLFSFPKSGDRVSKLMAYLGDLAVNGRKAVGATGAKTPKYDVVLPPRVAINSEERQNPPAECQARVPRPGLKQIYDKHGPKGFAKAVRDSKRLLITDTTMRDAHQSLLATRVRTKDILAAAPYASYAIGAESYSFENWGGATFDVCMRFLYESPWDRLVRMREAMPNVPFQMLLRGANGVGYTSYPDNAIFKFCQVAQKNGMDIFRIFDSVNYLENLYLGIDAVGAAGGVVEAAISYTGDVLRDEKHYKYNLDYYLELARALAARDIHVLAIKDMAGLLKPRAATTLISALRQEFPHLPIHVHTHDTAGTGVASMLAAAHAGADAVDVAVDSMSGLTSQPSMGAIVAALQGTELDTKIELSDVAILSDYWESARMSYAAFESGQKSGSSDVYIHEMPGGQYTNLLFQATQMGLADRWPQVKKAYADANQSLGDIVKVTPSSKTCGDLAQFMVTNNLSVDDVRRDAAHLNFPQSVIEFFQGSLGIPKGGFPEPFRQDVLKSANNPPTFQGRPGAELPPIDFEQLRLELQAKHNLTHLPDTDLMSAVMYPKVYDEFVQHVQEYGDVSILPTRAFIEPLEPHDEIDVTIERGKHLIFKLTGVGGLDAATATHEVFFEVNGVPRSVHVKDTHLAEKHIIRPKADPHNIGSVGASMPGSVVDVAVHVGQRVEPGEPLIVLSAMKLETVISAPCAGAVQSIHVHVGDNVDPNDLVVTIDETPDD